MDMRIFRDGVEIIPVEKWRVPAVLNVEQMKAAGKAIPYQGIYVYRVNDFAPRAVGTTASYTVTINDQATLKQIKLTLQSAMIEQMWKDFTPYQYGGRP
jgi:5,10-methenyltetrahydromethanopterin hydrogenase